MAEQMLFPVFDIVDTDEEKEKQSNKYYPSVYFDFELGDFVLDGTHRMIQTTGKDAYIQWCEKVINTEREAFLAYSSDIGTEFDSIIGERDNNTVEEEIKETITAALMVNPHTEQVSGFEFEQIGDERYVTFTVKGYDLEEEELVMPIDSGTHRNNVVPDVPDTIPVGPYIDIEPITIPEIEAMILEE